MLPPQVYWGPVQQLSVGARSAGGDADVAALLAGGSVLRGTVACTSGAQICACICFFQLR